MSSETTQDRGQVLKNGAAPEAPAPAGAAGAQDPWLAALASTELVGRSDGVPEEVMLTPWGWVETSHGRFLVDDEAARLVLAALEAQGTDLPIDYEHQTLGGTYAAPDGQAPAAGWIRRVEVRPGQGLFARVEWTPLARRRLAQREYRYLSPVALIRREDSRLIGLHSAALTNKPAIVGMQPIVARAEGKAASPEVALALHVETLRGQLGLPAGAGAADVLAAAGARLESLRAEIRRREAEQRVGEAVRRGKLTEAQKAWALDLCLRDPEAFARWEAAAPVVVPLGRLQPPAEVAPVGSFAARARAEYRAEPLLQALTSEEAYVADALRQAQSEGGAR